MKKLLIPLSIFLFGINSMAMDPNYVAARKARVQAASVKLFLGEWDNQTDMHLVISPSFRNYSPREPVLKFLQKQKII